MPNRRFAVSPKLVRPVPRFGAKDETRENPGPSYNMKGLKRPRVTSSFEPGQHESSRRGSTSRSIEMSEGSKRKHRKLNDMISSLETKLKEEHSKVSSLRQARRDTKIRAKELSHRLDLAEIKKQELQAEVISLKAKVKSEKAKSKEAVKALEKSKQEAKASQPPDILKDILANLRETVESNFQCVICNEMMIESISITCGHSFCQHCISQWKERKANCPICRKSIRNEVPNMVVNAFLEKAVDHFFSEEAKAIRSESIKERVAHRESSRRAEHRHQPQVEQEGRPGTEIRIFFDNGRRIPLRQLVIDSDSSDSDLSWPRRAIDPLDTHFSWPSDASSSSPDSDSAQEDDSEVDDDDYNSDVNEESTDDGNGDDDDDDDDDDDEPSSLSEEGSEFSDSDES